MTAIDRTAYPRPGARLTREELGIRYSLSDTDLAFIRATARGDTGRMLLATLLKTRQDIGYFVAALSEWASAMGLPFMAITGDSLGPIWRRSFPI
jgi:hypothetical protein